MPPVKELRKVEKIVFNQDRTHFAVMWSEGGFSKFDVASISVIQRVRNLPVIVQLPADFEFDQATEAEESSVTGLKKPLTRPMPKLLKSLSSFKLKPSKLKPKTTEDRFDIFKIYER